jgi:hypothetical protein
MAHLTGPEAKQYARVRSQTIWFSSDTEKP